MARNNGKRPHELTLELFAKNPTQTPSEIEAYVGNGPYASKHIWFLRKLGHDIAINKDGRTVVNYIYNGPGTAHDVYTTTNKITVTTKKAPKRQVADPVAAKQGKLRPAAAKPKAKKNNAPKTEEEIRAKNLETMKKVSAKLAKKAAAAKRKKVIDIGADEAEQVFGSNGEIATSFAVDNGWDSMDGINVADFLR